jgi:tetratricopeptide (TPR) repeat protein
MTSIETKRLLTGAVLLTSSFIAGGAPAIAQTGLYAAGTVIQSLQGDDAGSRLARYVKELAVDPRNVSALVGAGNAALEVGDPESAIGFFGRAEELAPRDARVKAGLGSAFVQTEQAPAALKFFGDAVALGLPVPMIAKDRGLAYDMAGDQGRAQADYSVALNRGADAEVERRLALSKAITGDREGALAVLEPQLRRNDRAGWRARAFVLALTGDTEGAVKAVEAVMPSRGFIMRPFLARLPQLGAADRALAVHFGHFPTGPNATYAAAQPVAPAVPVQSQPVRTAPVQTQQPAASAVPLDAGRPDPTQLALGVARPATAVQTQPLAKVAANVSVTNSAAAAVPVVSPVASHQEEQTTRLRSAGPGNFDFGDVIEFVQSMPGAVESVPEAKPVQLAQAEVKPKPKPAAEKKAAPAVDKKTQEKKAAEKKLADKKAAEKKAAEQKLAAEKKAAAKEPSRIWVQLAAAQDKKGFPFDFKRLKTKAPKLLSDKTAWTTPIGTGNRLLVGPFKTEKEARALVNELSKAKLSSYSWVSEAGQKVEKIPAK